LVAKVQRNKIAEVFKKGQRDKVAKALIKRLIAKNLTFISEDLCNFDLIGN
jgi:hypothetical protein